MRLLRSILLLLLFPLLACSAAGSLLRTVPEEPSTISSGGGDALYCDSWRLSVETNDAGAWTRIPARCIAFVDEYMNGERYASDSEVIAGEALAFAEAVEVAGDGKDVWIFDVDETLLSNVPYYAANGYGSQEFNETSFDEWVYLSKAPALSASLKLYTELRALGFQLVLLTGRAEVQRNATEQNLLFAGYGSWTQLILRGPSDIGKTAVLYKSKKRAELLAQGYRIHGNSGDQWSDLFGSPLATRSFKLPNPMYYIS